MPIRIKPVFSSTGTANRVAVFGNTGLLEASAVTTTELLLLSGLTGDILTTTNTKTVSNKTFAQTLVFSANNTWDIGSSGTRAKDAYLAGQLNAATGDFSGNVTVGGDLTVNGTTTTLNTSTLEVEDTNITVNINGNDAASEGAGLTVDRTGTSGSLIYANASATKFRAGALGSEVDLVGTTSTQTLSNKTLTVADSVIGGFTAGSIIFSNGTNLTQDNTNLFFDDTNNILKLKNSVYQFGSLDAFSRRQIWNYDTSAILRLGSWSADGDATNVSSEGIIAYDGSLTGSPIGAADGGYARVKHNRFGLFSIDSSLPAYVGGDYYFRVDDSTLYFRNNSGTKTFEITRSSGQIDTALGAGFVKSDASGILTSSAITDAELPNSYFLLAGRSGGQVGYGGTASGDDLTLTSTSHATKGDVILGQSYQEFSTSKVRFGDISVGAPATSMKIGVATDATNPYISFQGPSTQRWIMAPESSTWQFNRQANDVIGFALNTSSGFQTGDGSVTYMAGFSNAGNATTDITAPTTGNTTPIIGIRNRNTTVNNYTGIAFQNQQSADIAGIFGINENHTAAGGQTGHLAFLVANAGTKARAVKIAADKTVTMDAYGTGIAHFSSAGLISSSAIDLDSADTTGILQVPKGGLGVGTLTNHGVLLGQGTADVVATSVGATGTVLRGNSSGDPSFGAVVLTTDVSGVLPSANVGLGRTLNAQTGTTYTFVLSDGSAAGANTLVTASNAAAQTYTVPPNSSVAYPVGTQIDVVQLGAGKVTLAQGAGVTINSKSSNKAIGAQYVGVTLVKTATDTWLLLGDLIA